MTVVIFEGFLSETAYLCEKSGATFAADLNAHFMPKLLSQVLPPGSATIGAEFH